MEEIKEYEIYEEVRNLLEPIFIEIIHGPIEGGAIIYGVNEGDGYAIIKSGNDAYSIIHFTFNPEVNSECSVKFMFTKKND